MATHHAKPLHAIVVQAPEDDLLPWERQHRETAVIFHAFTHYRDVPQGVRTVRVAWTNHQTKCLQKTLPEGPFNQNQLTNWRNLSVWWGWVARTAAWDKYLDAQAREKLVQDQTEARARHARMAQAALQVLTIPSRVAMEVIQDPLVLQRYISEARATPRGLERLIGMVTSISHGLPGVVDVERLALGLSTERIEVEDKRADSIGHQVPTNELATALAIQLLDVMAGTGPGTAPKKAD
jgi:hypothetical protein